MRRYLTIALISSVLCVPTALPAADSIRMLYREKPPYSYTEQGVAKGFLLAQVKRIVDKAGIKAEFDVLPAKRIFAALENESSPVCTFGWYKTAERERFARYTNPIVTDRPHVILAHSASAPLIKKHRSLKSLFAASDLSITLVDGTSYGQELDNMIAASSLTIDRAVVSPLQAAQKIAAQRADFMLIDQEDYEHLLATDPAIRQTRLEKIEFPDMPAGLKRYILCSRSTSPEVISRLNSAISQTGTGRPRATGVSP